MKVYPWRQVDNQGDRKLVMKVMTSTATLFRFIGGVLSLGVANLVGLLLINRFSKRNDSWAKRGALMSLIGLIIFVALGGPAAWISTLNDVLLSFGDKVDISPVGPLIWFAARTLAFGFFFQGFAVMMMSYVYEVTGSRYLDRMRPTRKMKQRFKKNEVALADNDKPEEESIAFGLISDDPIPWRTARYGMICARPFKEMGHGVIVGGNGTGKTVLALSLAYQAAELDAAVLYIDFKASLRTLETMKQAAAKAGKKFYSFDLGTGSTETSWYDPLDWKGTPSEKASMIVNSLQFTEDGSASYYRGQANDWLIFQFDVINEVGLFPGESSFDFLLETSNPARMKDRIRALKSGDSRQQSLYTSFSQKVDMFKPQDLSALRQNLSIVVNAGGERLRPQGGVPSILMSRAVEEGAVVYFGLSPSTDQVALKTIGSLILRNLGVLSGERMRQADLGNLRPVITLVDEASRLQDRAVVMDNLLATAREGEIYLWMITQSFATWPESTVVEMNTNVQTHVAFRVQDSDTANHLISTLGDIPILEEMVEDKIKHGAFRGDMKERSGDGRTTLTRGPFLIDAPMEITSIENLYAYIWFTGSWRRATIEEWSPKRLKKPDTIRNDAPLVRIVFTDYETEAEPIKGTSFSELVTSADQVAYNMENTTLKRTRKDSLTDDNYPNVHGDMIADDGVQWGEAPEGVHDGYERNREQGNGVGVQEVWGSGEPTEPAWDDASGPRWEDPTPANASTTPQFAQDDGGLAWGTENAEDDAPPVPYFYKGASTGNSGSPGSSPATPSRGVPQGGSGRGTLHPDSTPSGAVDEDGLLWDSAPTLPPHTDARGEDDRASADESFAPESEPPSSPASPRQWVDDLGTGVDEPAGNNDFVPEVGPMPQAEQSQESNAVEEWAETPTTGTMPPAEPERTPTARPGSSGSTPLASPTEDIPASAKSARGATVGCGSTGAVEKSGRAGANVAQHAERTQGKSPSRKKQKPQGKKNASDDWL